MHTCTYKKRFFSAVAYSAKDFLALYATALKNLKRCSLQRLKFFSAVAYSAKKYKMAIFRPKPSQFRIFCPYERTSHISTTIPWQI
jgi:hypothetical protein